MIKLLIVLTLVGSHPLADSTFLPNGNNGEEEDTCIAKIRNIDRQGENILVLYTPNTCESAVDIISYFYEGFEHIIQPVDGVPGVVSIPNLRLSCSTIEITIITYISGHYEYMEELGRDVREYKTRLVAVTGLVIESNPEQYDIVPLSWDVQAFAEECALRYEINFINVNDTDKSFYCETPTDCFIEASELPMCGPVEIRVTPKKDDFEAETASDYFTRPIDGVPDFGAERLDHGFAAWFTPVEARPECGDVSYTVTQVDQDCFMSQISVQVVPKDVPSAIGQTVPKAFNRGPGRVINLNYQLKGGQVYLSWEAPEDGKDCGLVYIVTYLEGSEEKSIRTHSTSVQIPNQATICTETTIRIEASNGVIGPERILTIEGEFGSVKDLACRPYSGNAYCTWAAPENIKDCGLVEYKITYSDGVRVRNETTPSTEFLYPAKCGHVWIQIMPISGVRCGILSNLVVENVPECPST